MLDVRSKGVSIYLFSELDSDAILLSPRYMFSVVIVLPCTIGPAL
jgi:hypothetical protein